ncbi:MAG: hypothetical protein IPK26_17225 [Planctomycetes bacterium]|nr:hypothetical protein [Planctomycetota bacterium]
MITRRRFRVLGCGLLLLCGGCNLLVDELGWMDRLPPGVGQPDQAVPSALTSRP